MARNRKRAKERRRTHPVAARPGDGSLTAAGTNGAPDPIAHAAPDAELAEAQLALGGAGLGDEVDSPDEEEQLEALATASAPAGAVAASSGATVASRAAAAEPPADGRSALELTAATARAPAISTMARLVAFLQGSWAELQRVQWPDRRQVMQATGVVIGFVIVAGVFLGVADLVAGKLMDFVLK